MRFSAEEFVKSHEFARRWISVMIVIALLIGGVTLIAMKKAASAVTEDGADEIGMVLDAEEGEDEVTFEDFYGESADMEDQEDSEAADGSEEDSDNSDEEVSDEEVSDETEYAESSDEDIASDDTDSDEDIQSSDSDNEATDAADIDEQNTDSKLDAEETEDTDVEDELTKDVVLTVSYIDEDENLILDSDGVPYADEKEINLSDSMEFEKDARKIEGYTFKKAYFEKTDSDRGDSEKLDITGIAVRLYTGSDDSEFKYYEVNINEEETLDIKEDTQLFFVYEAAWETADDTKEGTDNDKKLAGSDKNSSKDVPESVDLSKFVTETVIERMNDKGEWEVISEADIKEGDHLRITVNYVLSKEAAASDDIHFDIPEQYGTAFSSESDLDDGNGSYEVTDDNQIKIQYNDDFKKKLSDDESSTDKDSSAADSSASINVSKSKKPSILSSVSGLKYMGGLFDGFAIKAHAARNGNITGSVTTETVVLSDKAKKGEMTIVDVSVKKNPERDYSSQSAPYKGGTEIRYGDEINNGDMLYFTLSYKLDIGTLNESRKSVKYSLKDHKITPINAVDGIVYDNSYTAVGTFSISGDGVVTFDFYDDFVEKNAKHEAYGNFYFLAQASASSNSEKVEKIYDFGDNVTFKVIINNVKGSDLSIQKQQSYDSSKGYMYYAITLSSVNGTKTDIVIDDVIKVFNATMTDTTENSWLTSLFTFNNVKGASIFKGDSRNPTYLTWNQFKVSNSGSKTTITLPKLNANEKYTLQYYFEVPEQVALSSAGIRLNNSANAKYDNGKNVSANVDWSFGGVPKISKAGEADRNSYTVTWRITLNEDHKNLKGYTLKDNFVTLLGYQYTQKKTPYKGDMWVESREQYAGKGSTLSLGSKITLGGNGYTFTKDDYTKYVFVYQVSYKPSDVIYQNWLVNEANINDGVNNNSTTGYAWAGTGNYVEKEATGINTIDSDKAKVHWKLTLKAPIKRTDGANNSEYFMLYEVLENAQVFTREDVESVKTAFRNAFGNAFEVQAKNNSNQGSVNGWRRLEIKIFTDVQTNVTLEFTSTAYIAEGTKKTSFKNKAFVYNSSNIAEATQDFEKISIEKFDGNNNAGDTSYEYMSDTLYKSGILSWVVKANIPANYEENGNDLIYIVDTLPEDVSLIKNGEYSGNALNGLEVAGDNGFKNAAAFGDGNCNLKFNNVNYTKTVEKNKIIISFKASEAKGQTVYFRVRAKIKDGYFTEETVTGEFTNSVMISNNGETPLDSSSQKQTITNTSHAITKDGKNVENSLNTVEYVVEVNPNHADLLKEGDTIRLTDTLTASSTADFTVTLVTGSVEVYEVSDDGTETPLPINRYTCSSSVYAAETGAYPYHWNYATLEMNLPDEMHLRIKYRYQFEGTADQYISANNKATLEGIVVSNNSAEDSKQVKIQEAGAKAFIKGINLYKVDNDNHNNYLSGAKFSLHAYDKNRGTFVAVPANTEDGFYTTNSAGYVPINNLTYNLAYKLVEEVAPDGYIKRETPYYFCIASTDTGRYPRLCPENFFTELNGEEITAGGSVFIGNDKATTSIVVEKKWENEDSTTKPRFITVKVGRRLGAEQSVDSSSYYTVNIDRRDGTNSITQYIGFPSVRSGSTLTFSFYVDYSNVYNKLAPEIKINGNTIDYSSELKAGSVQVITKTVTINSDTKITITDPWGINDANKYPAEAHVKAPQSSSDGNQIAIEENNYKEITITEDDDWVSEVPNLERYYTDKNSGKKYMWNYYVSEVQNVYYTASYSENNKTGIGSGTITITNSRNKVQPYELPSTGGTGELMYVVMGMTMMLIGLMLRLHIGRKIRKTDNN